MFNCNMLLTLPIMCHYILNKLFMKTALFASKSDASIILSLNSLRIKRNSLYSRGLLALVATPSARTSNFWTSLIHWLTTVDQVGFPLSKNSSQGWFFITIYFEMPFLYCCNVLDRNLIGQELSSISFIP